MFMCVSKLMAAIPNSKYWELLIT